MNSVNVTENHASIVLYVFVSVCKSSQVFSVQVLETLSVHQNLWRKPAVFRSLHVLLISGVSAFDKLIKRVIMFKNYRITYTFVINIWASKTVIRTNIFYIFFGVLFLTVVQYVSTSCIMLFFLLSLTT